MGGAEGKGEVIEKLISSNSAFFFIFGESNTSLGFSLSAATGRRVPPCGPAAEQTGLCWSAVVWLLALSSCTGLARLNEPAPFCSHRH